MAAALHAMNLYCARAIEREGGRGARFILLKRNEDSMDSLIIKWQQKALDLHEEISGTSNACLRQEKQAKARVYRECADDLAALAHPPEASEIGSPLWEAQQGELHRSNDSEEGHADLDPL